MTIKAKKRAFVGALIIGAAALFATFLPMLAWSDLDEPREIRLVARDMSFFIEGSDQVNPTLVFRPGERVKVTVRNEDAGMRHDFAIRDWSVGIRTLEDRGEADSVTFRVPGVRGLHTYICTPHSKMMSGTIRVE